MTGEPAHTASKESMVPELMFLSERVPQLYQLKGEMSIMLRLQLWSARYTVLQMKCLCKSIQSLRKIRMIRAPRLSITDLKVKWLCFAFIYFQPVTQRYKQRTAFEVPLQSIQSPGKYPFTNACIALLQIDILGWDTKEDKGESMT